MDYEYLLLTENSEIRLLLIGVVIFDTDLTGSLTTGSGYGSIGISTAGDSLNRSDLLLL